MTVWLGLIGSNPLSRDTAEKSRRGIDASRRDTLAQFKRIQKKLRIAFGELRSGPRYKHLV